MPLTKAEKRKRRNALWDSFCHWTDYAVEPSLYSPDTASARCASCWNFNWGVCPLAEHDAACVKINPPYKAVYNTWRYNGSGSKEVAAASVDMAILLQLMYYSEGGRR